MKEQEKKVFEDLINVFVNIDNISDMKKFFKEIFTEKELERITLRWHLMQKVYRGIPQRNIAKELGISLCKITRGSKILKSKDSISFRFLEKSNLSNTKKTEE